jgi:hypothetical protein
MDSKYTVVQSSGRVVERYRGKRTQPKRLDGASMRDPSFNLPQGGEIDNHLQIVNPIARLHRSEGAVMRGI